jgi:uncharacterized membrane protein
VEKSGYIMVDALIGIMVMALSALSAFALIHQTRTQLERQHQNALALHALHGCLSDPTMQERSWTQNGQRLTRLLREEALSQPVLSEQYVWLIIECQVGWSVLGRDDERRLAKRLLFRR